MAPTMDKMKDQFEVIWNLKVWNIDIKKLSEK